MAVVSMDLSKAFDAIQHSLLLAKLKKAYGLDQACCALIKDYLSSWNTGGTFFRVATCKTRRASGKRPGPMFFNIFINHIFLFCGDVKVKCLCRRSPNIFIGQ